MGPDPPPVRLTEEMRWILLSAFGPRGGPSPPSVDPIAAREVLHRLALATRVASRTSREELSSRLGQEGARAALEAYLESTVRHLRLVEEMGRVAAIAAELSVPLVFLKFGALHLSGLVEPGQREARDLDILAPVERLEELAEALDKSGYEAGEPPTSEQHIASRRSPDGVIVEPHLKILGVRPPGDGRSATVESLTRHEAIRPVPELPGKCFVPIPEVLSAHAIVHALAQHGLDPGGYPPTRMLADLIDLGFAALESTAGVARWIATDVAPGTVDDIQRLCLDLEKGDIPPSGLLAGPGTRWLRHVLAGRLDADYQRALRLKLFRRPLGDGPRSLLRLQGVFHAVFPTRRQIDAIYGPPKTEMGYLARRILRPLDLVLRAGRYTMGFVRLRSRSRNDSTRGGA